MSRTGCSNWPRTSPTRSAPLRARVRRLGRGAGRPGQRGLAPALLGRLSTEKIVFFGASTGGTEATREVLQQLPADFPAVMITQHMPPGFTKSYAARLDGLCRIRVAEAVDGERVLPGHAYIAPGGHHLSVERSGSNYIARVGDGDPVNRHKPSVEVLFLSAARVAGPNALGVMLTGMGGDGARAMRAMREAGSHNLVQDEASCVVFGMPARRSRRRGPRGAAAGQHRPTPGRAAAQHGGRVEQPSLRDCTTCSNPPQRLPTAWPSASRPTCRTT